MTQPRTSRRSLEQWQALIDQWQDSGLSARQFCSEQAVGYASFCAWRRRRAEISVASEPDARFIDLGAFSEGLSASGWNIVLSLGDGIELRLSRS